MRPKGWAIKMIERYTRAAHQARRARNAMTKGMATGTYVVESGNSITRTMSDDDAHRRRHADRSDRAFAAKPRAYGAPQKRHYRFGTANGSAGAIGEQFSQH